MPYVRGKPCDFCGAELKGSFRLITLKNERKKICGFCDSLFDAMFHAFREGKDDAMRKIYAFISRGVNEDTTFKRKKVPFKSTYERK